MAHRRRGYDDRRRSQEGDDFRASPGRFGDSSRDRGDRGREPFYEEDNRRKHFSGRDDGRSEGNWEEHQQSRGPRAGADDDSWDIEQHQPQDQMENRRDRRRRAQEQRDRRQQRHSRSSEDVDDYNSRDQDFRDNRDDYNSRDSGRDGKRDGGRDGGRDSGRDDYREHGGDRDREWREREGGGPGGRDRSRRRWREDSREGSPHSDSFIDPNCQLGEWNCRCGALNFKRRFTCYRQYCGASRNEAVSVKFPIDKPTLPHPSHHPQHRPAHKRPPNPPQPHAPVPPKQTYTAEDIPRLAAYSAQMYAANVQEQATYLKYYTDYYTQQLMEPSESDKVNAAAAVAQSAINQLQARTPVVTPPNGTDNRMYPVPDTSAYLYDETSGYYYDSVTGLYYDPNTQYYFNNQINQYLYWDMAKFTYLLAQQSAAPPPPVISTPATPTVVESAPVEEKKKGEKTDKVKVAKKIAKDMERWAKTLNQKKDIARGNMMPETSKSSLASVSADIGFSVLEKRVPVNSAPPVAAPPPPPPTLVPSYGAGSDSSGDESEGIIDWNKLACLLCKRQFPSREVLEKHQVMSDLHRQNLEALKTSRSNKDLSYRDRAAERRMKYGEDEPIIVRNVRPDPVMSSVPQAIGEENIGNKLLQKMGWTAGQGLGKEGQGRIGPVEAQGGGLGRKKGIYTAGPGETYKECVKKLTMARYQDLIGSEHT